MWHAIWIILVADLTMSLDNVLALAGASKGNLFLLLFGLITSIPLVVFAAAWLARLMDRYPIIVYLGAALLGKVSAEMIFTDPIVEGILQVSDTSLYILEAAGAAAVVIVARVYLSYIAPKMSTQPARCKLMPGKSQWSIPRKVENDLRFGTEIRCQRLLIGRRISGWMFDKISAKNIAASATLYGFGMKWALVMFPAPAPQYRPIGGSLM